MKKLLGLVIILLSVISCTILFETNVRRNYSDVNALLRGDTTAVTFLKAHTRNGDVYLLKNDWKISEDKTKLSCKYAEHYNARRIMVGNGPTDIPLAEVVLIETNRKPKSMDVAYFTDLGIVTIFDALITMYCISNPKACWGSCPTFYYDNDQYLFASRAEGFSSSIAPCLEKGDIDALNNPVTLSKNFKLIMKNEALETHAVNQVELLAIAREAGKRAFQDQEGKFYQCSMPFPPAYAHGAEGDILEKVSGIDEKERFSLTDGEDLNAKEYLDFTFKTTDSHHSKGLILNFRQSLLPTFLFYSAMSYMGDEASDVLAGVETNPIMKQELESSFKFLGGIEVMAWNEQQDEWQKIETLFEAGPIARNLQLVAIPASFAAQKEIRVRLKLSKGLWRIDYAGLVNIDKVVTPFHLKVETIVKNGFPDKAAAEKLRNDDKSYLLSLPGDRFELNYVLPDETNDYELFVYSKGYYLEWMRKEWLGGKDLLKLRKMVLGDEKTWKDLAREFKQLEPSMEATFWNSRVNL